MEEYETIKKFALQRPKSNIVYGYGSSLFYQEGNKKSNSSMIDLIFIVEDMKKWHLENIERNPDDYSFMGRVYIQKSNIRKLKGPNKVTYLSYIKDGNLMYKYGVIELEDFLNCLKTWDSFFIAGRFQKPVAEIMNDGNVNKRTVDNYINYNRKCALKIACLFCDSVTSLEKIFMTLCGLSYYGDIRMKLAENPDKVKNIVNGSYEELLKMYALDEHYLKIEEDGVVKINHEVLLKNVKFLLPKALVCFLEDNQTDFTDLDSVRINVDLFLSERNKKDSGTQAFECFKTNGIVKSVPYALAKIKKRFIK